MIHQAAGGFSGTASDIEIRAKEILRIQARLRDIMAYHTGQPLERIERDSDRDFFMTPEQSRDYGIIDEVIGRTPGLGDPPTNGG
jgi:ATP-dependent Clp protease protease subunit